MATFKRPSEYGNGAPAEPQTSSAWAEFLRSLEAKLATTKGNLGQIESERAEQSLAAELGDQTALGRLAAIRSELEAGERALEAVELAGERARTRLQEARGREADERESQRQQEIQQLKGRLLEAAQQFDAAAIEMKRTLDLYFRVADDLHNRMNGSEQANFHDVRSSRGPSGALGHHGLARPLGLLGISGNPMHHRSLVSYLKPFCGPPSAPAAPAPPQRETVTIEYTTEAEALSRAKPRS
jgi:hypothetical protein